MRYPRDAKKWFKLSGSPSVEGIPNSAIAAPPRICVRASGDPSCSRHPMIGRFILDGSYATAAHAVKESLR